MTFSNRVPLDDHGQKLLRLLVDRFVAAGCHGMIELVQYDSPPVYTFQIFRLTESATEGIGDPFCDTVEWEAVGGMHVTREMVMQATEPVADYIVRKAIDLSFPTVMVPRKIIQEILDQDRMMQTYQASVLYTHGWLRQETIDALKAAMGGTERSRP